MPIGGSNPNRSPCRLLLVALVIAVLMMIPAAMTGCTGLYFRDVAEAPQPAARLTLANWAYHEYWTGIVFNGEKIGFTHLAIRPPAGGEPFYVIESEAVLAFHFLGFSKKVTLHATDWVDGDLRLQRFQYEYDLDGHKLRLAGTVTDDQLIVERVVGRTSGDTTDRASSRLEAPLYPTSAIPLYPTLEGLAVGKTYTYQVYEGQRQEIATVEQTVEAYQASDLFEGRAFKVDTSMGGQNTTLWVNRQGLPVLEMAWNDLLFSTLESETGARAFLAQASVNKHDVLVDYSRIPTSEPLPHPRRIRKMEVVINHLPPSFEVPSDSSQRCRPLPSMPERQVDCVIQTISLQARSAESRQSADATSPSPEVAGPYLLPSRTIDSADPRIRETAQNIVGEADRPMLRIERLVRWLDEHVEQKPVDVFTSLDVLESREAECQGLAWLYTAFARSLGIPTRVANGLVYSEALEGFLYHTWAESYVDGNWVPLDPTFGQLEVDATHIKLVEGEEMADLVPLVDLIGTIGLDIRMIQRGSDASS